MYNSTIFSCTYFGVLKVKPWVNSPTKNWCQTTNLWKKKVKLHPTPGRSGSQYSSLIPKLQRFRKVSWFSFRFAWMGAGTLRENPPNSSIRRFGLSNFPSKNSLNIKLSKPENSGFCDGSLTVKRVKIIQVGRWHTLELHFVLVGHLLFFGLAVPRWKGIQ